MTDPRLLDPAKTANEILQDRAIRHAIYIERLKVGEVRSTLAELNALYDELVARTFKVLDRIATRGAKVREFKSIRNLTRDLNRIAVDQYDSVARELMGRMEALAAAESRWQLAAITESATVPLTLKAPSRAILRAIVHNEPFGDPTRAVVRTLRGWFEAEGEMSAFRIQSALDVGLRQGDTVARITRRVRDTFGVSGRNAETWVRTGINNTVTLARERTYEENAEVVKGVQLLATLDSRTTVICMGEDGNVYPISEGPRPPLHPRCRTTTLPVLKSWKELGIPLKELPEGTRASMNGQVPESVTYGEWLKTQSREFQDDVLGPKRAELFRTGAVPIDRFTDERLRPLTLSQIVEREKLSPLTAGAFNPKAPETIGQYRAPNGVWAPERQKLHDEIVREHLAGLPSQKNPTFHMMGGGPASGKSTVIKTGDVNLPPGNVLIDSDAIKAKLPEYRAMQAAKAPGAAAFAHEESSYLSKRILAEAGDRRINAVLDGTGNGSTAGIFKKAGGMRERGYRVVADYVTVDTETALARNLARAAKTGRMVPASYVSGVHETISRILPDAIEGGAFDDFRLWDTNASGPRLVANLEGGRLKIFDERLWLRFLQKAGG
ncbi:MAG TPA: zeta toxin family protein [Polyangiales bacterium]|nr:zeta toxin family protein [Polyangiales bacterium]